MYLSAPDSIISVAERQLKELRVQREQLDVRITELETFVRVGQTLPIPTPAETLSRLGSGATASKPTFKSIIVSTAEKIIAERRYAPTIEIVRELERNGVAIGNADDDVDKVVRVSTILSKAGIFKPDRARGWSAKK